VGSSRPLDLAASFHCHRPSLLLPLLSSFSPPPKPDPRSCLRQRPKQVPGYLLGRGGPVSSFSATAGVSFFFPDCHPLCSLCAAPSHPPVPLPRMPFSGFVRADSTRSLAPLGRNEFVSWQPSSPSPSRPSRLMTFLLSRLLTGSK